MMTMKRIILLAGFVLAILTATAQDNDYIVKTKGVKKPAKSAAGTDTKADEAEPTDFMGKNFRYYSMCDWKEGMRFMVIPEKYDLLVNTFRDAETNREVSSARLRHSIMVYEGYEQMPNARVHILFHCETDDKDYYYELPYGSYEDYCYSKQGVPTLAFLGDVDKARELLTGQLLLTRSNLYRVDTEYEGDGYKEIAVDKNQLVTVKAIGVGTRSFPVKIIVENEHGDQFYQCVAMSKTNSGLRDDEFIFDNEKFLFQGSFELTSDIMAVSDNIRDYLNQTVHTNRTVSMSSKGSGKIRDVKVPRFTGFIIDEIAPIRNSKYYTLTLRETESRRIYYKDVAFKEADVATEKHGKVEEDFFGYIFGMGEGVAKETSKETRAAIREGRVIKGMTIEEAEMAMGEANNKVVEKDGTSRWEYQRSNDVILDVWIDKKGIVTRAKARKSSDDPNASDQKKKEKKRDETDINTVEHGTPLHDLFKPGE